MPTACVLCKIAPADHLEDGRSRKVDPPYPVCRQCGQDLDYMEQDMSPIDRRHWVRKSPILITDRHPQN